MNLIFRALDAIYLMRVSDEIRVAHAGSDSAQSAGMFQVFLPLYVAIMGLLAPLARLAMVGTNLINDRALLYWDGRKGWFIGVAVGAFVIAVHIVRKRYWHRELPPKPVDNQGKELDPMLMIVVTLLGSLGFTALTFLLCFHGPFVSRVN